MALASGLEFLGYAGPPPPRKSYDDPSSISYTVGRLPPDPLPRLDESPRTGKPPLLPLPPEDGPFLNPRGLVMTDTESASFPDDDGPLRDLPRYDTLRSTARPAASQLATKTLLASAPAPPGPVATPALTAYPIRHARPRSRSPRRRVDRVTVPLLRSRPRKATPHASTKPSVPAAADAVALEQYGVEARSGPAQTDPADSAAPAKRSATLAMEIMAHVRRIDARSSSDVRSGLSASARGLGRTPPRFPAAKSATRYMDRMPEAQSEPKMLAPVSPLRA
mmetsp:Transcript_7529/g.16089  ORF Transcript_7529/g.16089 Transcript_7529/m.16089 type:complete len:279 (-) Transcript_7529:187-1023(-)